jgi:hypothetical protein
LTRPGDQYYLNYYTLGIMDTGSTFTVNYSSTHANNYTFTVQTSLSQSTPASSFGSPTPLLEQLGSSDPYGLYFTDSLYESAMQRTTPYYSGFLTNGVSGNSFGPAFPDSSAGTYTYQMGNICPIITPGYDAEVIPTFSIFRINTSNLPSPWTNYSSTNLGGGYWKESTKMSGSDWNYTWYAATTQPS